MSQPAPRHRIKAQERAQKWRSGRESSSSGTFDLVDAVERSTSSSPHRGDAELPIQSISGLTMNDDDDDGSNVEETNIFGNEPTSNVDLRRDDVSFKPNGALTSLTVEAEPLRVSSDPLETFESILTQVPLQLSTLGQPLVPRRKMNEAMVLQNNGVSARSSSSASALPPPPIRSLEDVYPPGIVDVPSAGDESDLTELVDDQSWRDEEASQRDDFEPFRVYDTEDGIPFDDSKIKINTPVRPSPVLPAFVRGIHNRTHKANGNGPKSTSRAATAEEGRAVVSAPKLTTLNHSDEESDNGRVVGDDNVNNDDGLKLSRHVANESPDLTMNVAPPSRYSSAMKLQDVQYPFGTDDDNPDDDDALTTRHAVAMAQPLSSSRKHEQVSNRDGGGGGGGGDGIVVSKNKNKPKEEHPDESSLRREEVSKSKSKISNRKRLPSQSCLATVIVAALICILVAGFFCLAYFAMPSSLFKSAAPPTTPTVDDAFSHMDRNDGDESIRDLLRLRQEGGRGARDFHSSDFSPLSSSSSSSSLSPSAYSPSKPSPTFWSKFWFYTPLETGILDDIVDDDDDDDRSYLRGGSVDYKRPSSVSMDDGTVDAPIFESLRETHPGAIQPRQPYDSPYYETNSDRVSPTTHHAPYSTPPPTRQQSHQPATPTSHAPLASDGPGKNGEEQDRKRSKMHWVQRPARLMSDEQILKQTMNSVIYLMQWLSEQKTAANFDLEALNNLNAIQKSCLNELTFGPYRERLAQKFVSQMILQTCTAPSEELLGRYANLFFGTFDDYEPFMSMLHATET